MSRIDELIYELAPQGVPLQPLGDPSLGEFIRGNGMQKSDLTEEGVPAIHYGEIHTFYDTWTDRTKSFTSPALAARLRRARPGDVIIATTSEDQAAVAKATAWLGEGEVAVSGDAYIYRHTLDPRYVSYFFQSDHFQTQKAWHINGTKVRRISGDALAKIRIPVPPIEVQREVVKVLDQLTLLKTELEAALEAELEARRHQHEHYCKVLLASSDDAGVREVALGKVIRPNFGSRITKAKNSGALFPVYGGGGESFRTDAFNREDEWVISRFAMSENCVRRVRGKFWMLDSGFTFSVTDDDVDKDYIGRLLLSMQPIIFATSTQSAQKNIDVEGFKRLMVSLPSLPVQRKVAEALDQFDALVSDLSGRLPEELASRQRQYEYYRERLLTFKQPMVEEAAA